MSQLCRVNQDPDEISGLLGVVEMKGLKGRGVVFLCQSKKADRDILHPLEPEVHLVDHVPHEVGEDLSVLGGLQLMDSL
jgi:hypothetical protein